MPAQFDMAIVLRVWEWSETSQTASLLSRDHGVIRGLAKGSRRPRGVFSGGLEVLTRGEIGFIARPSSELALLTEWSLEEVFPVLRRHLPSHYAAMYAADLVHHLFQPRDPHPGVFEDVAAFVKGLSPDADLPAALARVQWSLLRHAGLAPAVTSAPGGVALAFFPHRGELGPAQPDDASPRPSGPAWRVRETTAAYLRALARGGPPPATDPRTPDRVARLLASYLRVQLDQQVPSLVMVFPDLGSGESFP